MVGCRGKSSRGSPTTKVKASHHQVDVGISEKLFRYSEENHTFPDDIKRGIKTMPNPIPRMVRMVGAVKKPNIPKAVNKTIMVPMPCLLYTSDAADE